MPFTFLANTVQFALGWKLRPEERRILSFFICHLPFSIFHLKEEDWETVLKADTEFEPNVPSSVTPTGKWQINNEK
jgi:hypothetical protein